MLHTQAHEVIDYLDHATIIKAGNISGEIKHFFKNIHRCDLDVPHSPRAHAVSSVAM